MKEAAAEAERKRQKELEKQRSIYNYVLFVIKLQFSVKETRGA